MTDRERAEDAVAYLKISGEKTDDLEKLFRDARTATLQEAAQRVEKALNNYHIPVSPGERSVITDAIWGKK